MIVRETGKCQIEFMDSEFIYTSKRDGTYVTWPMKDPALRRRMKIRYENMKAAKLNSEIDTILKAKRSAYEANMVA